MSRMAKTHGLTLEITEGISENANRVALKGVFTAFGDVLACWVPPIDRRGIDNGSVRFADAQAAENAKQACDAGQVFFQGIPLKVKWRVGGGPRVGNSDVGGCVNKRSPSPEREKWRVVGGSAERRRSRSRGRRRSPGRRDRGHRDRSGSRSRRRRSRDSDTSCGRDERDGLTRSITDVQLPPHQPFPQLDFMQLPPCNPVFSAMVASGMPGHFSGGAIPGQLEYDPAVCTVTTQCVATEPPDPAAEEARRREAEKKRAALTRRGPGVAALVQGALQQAQIFAREKEKEKEKKTERGKERERATEQEKEKLLEQEREKNSNAETSKTRSSVDKRTSSLAGETTSTVASREKELQPTTNQTVSVDENIKLEPTVKTEKNDLSKSETNKRQRVSQDNDEPKLSEDEKARHEQEMRNARVKAGVEAAKNLQAAREKKDHLKNTAVKENLYGDMPEPDVEQEAELNASRVLESASAQRNLDLALPPQDRSKIVFLDIDGVLRPARAGGFDVLWVDGAQAVHPDTSDFFPSAMKALRHIIERTGAIIVLSSEWRRNETMQAAVDHKLAEYRLRACSSITRVDLDRELGSGDPVRSFAARRACEISSWLHDHENEVKGWVVLDDINLAIADEDKKTGTKAMASKLVQTWPLCGLTMGNAKTAVRILNGEIITKVLVERPKAPGGGPSVPSSTVDKARGTSTPFRVT